MLRRFHLYRAVWPLLTGLLIVAACNNVIACEFCPQKTRNTSHCADKDTGTDSLHSVNHERAPVVTEQTEQCSHCFTHSPGQANSSLRAVVLNNSAHGIITADDCVVAVKFSSSTNPVEIHDHGPPGRSSPRYVLNNTFRI